MTIRRGLMVILLAGGMVLEAQATEATPDTSADRYREVV